MFNQKIKNSGIVLISIYPNKNFTIKFQIKEDISYGSIMEKVAGKGLMAALECYVKKSKNMNWAVSLELISSKEAVDFYKKFGFEERPCDWDGPGMFKMVR